MSHLPALPQNIYSIVDEFERKSADVEAAIEGLKQAYLAINMAGTIQGTFAGQLMAHQDVPRSDAMRRNLLQSGWKAVYNRLQIDRIATAKDKKLFERTLENPPPLTVENAKATFGRYFEDPRWHILRGLAEAFVVLDPAYKSHSKVKIGVKGLPKRIVLTYWGEYSCSGARDQFRDMVNALAVYQNKPHFEWEEMQAIDSAHYFGEDAICDGRSYISRYDRHKRETYSTIDRGLTVRRFKNGNAHVIFTPETLLDINRALAEFYGEVLPDVETSDTPKQVSCAVSKDLQFYWSPPAVVNAALDLAELVKPEPWRREQSILRVLEPSCGDGRILDAIRDRGHVGFGIEYHAGRAAICRANGHAVLTANFLEQPATPEFDAVVMNPPFYGRHYAKHVRHALGFLRPGGVLVAVLPASAQYDHGELQGDLKGQWQDLPPGSFADAGTNVPTGLLKIVKARRSV